MTSGAPKAPSPQGRPEAERRGQPEEATVQSDIARYARMVELAAAGDERARAGLEAYARQINEQYRSPPPACDPRPPTHQYPKAVGPTPLPSTASPGGLVVSDGPFVETSLARLRKHVFVALLAVGVACYVLGFLTATLVLG